MQAATPLPAEHGREGRTTPAEVRARLARLVTGVRRETTLAQGGLAVIALHVLDDNFIQPQPGTSATDHLISGLVPTALLVSAAAVYPRLRAGLRAAMVIPVGVIGIVAGASEAGYYTYKVGPSGDDYTGLLAIPAGVLLIGIGVVTLWRTRRTDDGLGRRYLRRFLWTVCGAAVALLVVFPLALSYVYTHVGRAVVPTPVLGAAHENVAFTTSDGLRLRGWYVPSKNRAAVVAFPGRKGPQRQTRMLVRHGYGVLLFDRRGEGESDGDPNSFGWAGERDVKAAVAFLQHRSDVDRNRIGGIGLSVGGEMMIEAAAESDGLRAIVSEGAGARSIREVRVAKAWSELSIQVFLTAGMTTFSNHLPPPSLEALASRIAPRPVFFIYATHGTGGQEKTLNPKYYAAAGQPKVQWEIPEAGHTGGIEARPKEYERRVVGFFDRALLVGK
jgi:fermentation-respiration switch protein FrsA (DUF1100 family)